MRYETLKIDETDKRWLESHPVKIEWFDHQTAKSVLLAQPEDDDVLAEYARAKNLAGWFGRYDNEDWCGPMDSAEEAADALYEAFA
jgi:hypothetical protein